MLKRCYHVFKILQELSQGAKKFRIFSLVAMSIITISTTGFSQQGVINYVRTFETRNSVMQAPTPSGLTFNPSSGNLFISDSEINQGEGGTWNCENIFEVPVTGDQLVASYDAYNQQGQACPPTSNKDWREPTGITYLNGFYYITDDNDGLVMKYNANFGAPLIQVRAQSGDKDVEGIGSNPIDNLLYVIIGKNNKVQIYEPDNLDFIDDFFVPNVITDPEGIVYSSFSNHLFVVSTLDLKVYEVDLGGNLLFEYDISENNGFPSGRRSPQGLVFAPSSDPNDDPDNLNIYIADGLHQVHEADIPSEDPGVVPVELVSFSADVSEEFVKLMWQTATETNNFGFDIERRIDGVAFSKIGFVPGHGTTTIPQIYDYEDKDVLAGRTYSYRLKQIDTDGSFEHSAILQVEINLPQNFVLSQNFPNPFNPETSIRYELPEAVDVKVSIFNLLGNEIRTLVHEQKEAGVHSIIWNGKDNAGREVATGAYLYRIKAGEFVETKRVTLLR